MTDADDNHGRTEPPLTGDEAATLLGFLDYQRGTLAWKCSGLDAAGLAATLPPSSLSLGGMLKHLTIVEDSWFGQRLAGREPASPWDPAVWADDPDHEWHSAGEDTPDDLRRHWQDAVDRSREAVAEALATGDLGQLARRGRRDGKRPSMRWILAHMIEEYARHNGQADLIRESIDGLTGE